MSLTLSNEGAEVLLLHAEQDATYQIHVSVNEEKGTGTYQLLVGKDYQP